MTIRFIVIPDAAGGSASLSADAGAYSLTGTTSLLNLQMLVDAGAYSISGQAEVGNTTLNAAAGAYSITGAAASFAQNFSSGVGSYNLTGASAKFDALLSAASGSYAITGAAATLTATGISSYTLSADAGAYSITGAAASFPEKMLADAGVYTLSGSAASFDDLLNAGTGSYVLTGADANLVASADVVMLAESGSYVITGSAANLVDSGVGPIARPRADTASGSWLPSTGATLYGCVDEATADDTDYIYANSATTCQLALSSVVDPGTTSGQVVSYRAWSPSGNGLVVRLKCGATTVATWTHATLPGTVTQYDQSLSAGEIAAITDYADLRVEFEST